MVSVCNAVEIHNGYEIITILDFDVRQYTPSERIANPLAYAYHRLGNAVLEDILMTPHISKR
jgi:hypothetical protein